MRKYLWATLLLLLAALIPFLPTRVSGQSGTVQSRISQAVDNTKLAVLRGNVHPLARTQYDRGAAPASLPMEHMMLVLQRSTQQEATLDTLLAQQQDRSSPNYHQWLSPQAFGQQFGPSDQDIQAVTSWLQSEGFQVNQVANGRTTIDFSGTAGSVQQAFHTAIHSYVLANGEQHWANSSDPQIPLALTPVVAGVNSLNNFRHKPFHTSHGMVRKNLATGKFSAVPGIKPQFTFAGAPDELCNGINGSNNCWAVGPGDLAVIYNIPSSITGVGQTIAIVSDSDVYATDVTAFRSAFILPSITTTTNGSPACPTTSGCFDQIETGTDPGVIGPTTSTDDEGEAILDVEWAGAVAPNATIDLVVSPTTNAAFGGDTSAAYVINCRTTGTNCPVAVPAAVLSDSYGACELQLGTAENTFYNTQWQQAAAEGITVVIAAGDNGSAGCDNDEADQPAEFGLQVNGTASPPYNVAVGGTDFNDLNNATTYWNNIAGALTSAKGYIPETTYNDSCTNSIISTAVSGSSSTSAATFCNSVAAENDGFWTPAGGSGGVSNCTVPTGPSPSNCTGGYAKPYWQVGTGVPNDGKRDIPDVSLFAGDGTIQNFYIICEADEDPGAAPCNLSAPYEDFLEEGGTSVSAQAFAGVVALIDQNLGGRQGNINPMLYGLASTTSGSSIFNDITFGTNAMPCVLSTNSPGCTNTGNSSFTVGILTGYSAGTGFDLATGLGSMNIGNLITHFGPFSLTSSNPVVTVSSPGASGSMTLYATAGYNYTGTLTLACSGLPTGATCSFSPSTVTFTSSSTIVPVTVTVNTTTASRLLPFFKPWGAPIWMAAALLLTLALLLMFLFRDSQRRKLGWSLAMLFLGFSLVTGMVACGGGGSSSTSTTTTTTTTTTSTGTTGNTTSAVTATSGSNSFSMPFTVNIQ